MNALETLKTVMNAIGNVQQNVKFQFDLVEGQITLSYDSSKEYKYTVFGNSDLFLEFNNEAEFTCLEDFAEAYNLFLIKNFIRTNMRYFPKSAGWNYNNLYLMCVGENYKLLDIAEIYNEIHNLQTEEEKLKVIQHKLTKYLGATGMAIPIDKKENYIDDTSRFPAFHIPERRIVNVTGGTATILHPTI